MLEQIISVFLQVCLVDIDLVVESQIMLVTLVTGGQAQLMILMTDGIVNCIFNILRFSGVQLLRNTASAFVALKIRKELKEIRQERETETERKAQKRMKMRIGMRMNTSDSLIY